MTGGCRHRLHTYPADFGGYNHTGLATRHRRPLLECILRKIRFI